MTLAEQLPVDIVVMETRSRGVEPIIEVVTEAPTNFENCITPVDKLLAVVYMNDNEAFFTRKCITVRRRSCVFIT